MGPCTISTTISKDGNFYQYHRLLLLGRSRQFIVVVHSSVYEYKYEYDYMYKYMYEYVYKYVNEG
jgi:hypothetical protein